MHGTLVSALIDGLILHSAIDPDIDIATTLAAGVDGLLSVKGTGAP